MCGSKALFKAARDEIKQALALYKDEFADALLAHFKDRNLAFIKQEFNIKKDFGGLEDYANLDSLLLLLKDSPKNYALHFVSEKELSELRLATDFLLSLQSAMNIQNGADTDKFLFSNAGEISLLMKKKDKKNLDAKNSMLQKAMSCLHTIGFYTRYISMRIQFARQEPKFQPLMQSAFMRAEDKIFISKRQVFSTLKDFLDA